MRQGKKTEAYAAFERSIEARRRLLERKPDDAVVLNNQGVALTHVGRCEEAVSYLGKAASGHPDPVLVQTNLARCFDRLGRHDEALAALREAARLDPEEPVRQQRVEQYLRQLGRAQRIE